MMNERTLDYRQYFIRSDVRVSKVELELASIETTARIMAYVRNNLVREVSENVVKLETKRRGAPSDHTVEFYVDAYLIPADELFALLDQMVEDRIRQRSLRGTL